MRQFDAKGRPRVSKCPERPFDSMMILSQGENFVVAGVQSTSARAGTGTAAGGASGKMAAEPVLWWWCVLLLWDCDTFGDIVDDEIDVEGPSMNSKLAAKPL